METVLVERIEMVGDARVVKTSDSWREILILEARLRAVLQVRSAKELEEISEERSEEKSRARR